MFKTLFFDGIKLLKCLKICVSYLKKINSCWSQVLMLSLICILGSWNKLGIYIYTEQFNILVKINENKKIIILSIKPRQYNRVN